MNYPSSFYKCACGEPIEPKENWCLSCHTEYENKYGPDVFHFATVGYENGLILIQDPKGNIQKVTPEVYQRLENEDYVWHSALGVYNMKNPK